MTNQTGVSYLRRPAVQCGLGSVSDLPRRAPGSVPPAAEAVWPSLQGEGGAAVSLSQPL